MSREGWTLFFGGDGVRTQASLPAIDSKYVACDVCIHAMSRSPYELPETGSVRERPGAYNLPALWHRSRHARFPGSRTLRPARDANPPPFNPLQALSSRHTPAQRRYPTHASGSHQHKAISGAFPPPHPSPRGARGGPSPSSFSIVESLCVPFAVP